MAMTKANAEELQTLITDLWNSLNSAGTYASDWCSMNGTLTTDINGAQITEMIALITAEMTDVITKYGTLKTAWDGY